MGLTQLNFAGLNKIEVAIARIQQFEPLEGYFLTHSGGKDSDCTLELCKMAKVKYEVHYSQTGIDPPELIYHMREYHPEIIITKPEITIWQGIQHHGLPTMFARWCCELLKEQQGQGRLVITGIRASESVKRSKRQMVESCIKGKGKRFLHPIIDWTNNDVWEFIKVYNIPYCSLYDEGWKRIGCIGCPMSVNRSKEFERYPKIKDAWYRAAKRFMENPINPMPSREKFRQQFNSVDDLWEWWLQPLSIKNFKELHERPMFV